MKSYSLYRRAQSIAIKHQWNPEWLMIRGNRNKFVSLAVQHHPRSHSSIRGLWWQRPETQAQVISICWTCGSMVFYKLLTAAWEILQHPKLRTLEQALLCFPWVLVHLLTELFPANENDFPLRLLLYIVREMKRVLHSGNVFTVSHPINPLFVCFVELSQDIQNGLLSD